MSEADSTERNLRMKFEIRCADWKFVKIPSALIGNTSITDGAKVTYGALVVWGRETGKAWPSRKLLSAARGLKERTLRSHLSELERAGWVTRLVTESRTIVTLHKESICQGGGITIPEGRHYDSGGGGITIPEGRQQIATEVEDRSRNHKNKKPAFGSELFQEGTSPEISSAARDLFGDPRPTVNSEGSHPREGGVSPVRAGGLTREAQRESPERETKNNSTLTKGEKPDLFDEFWATVRRKKGKGAARRAWKAAIKKCDPQVIIEASKAYTGSMEAKEAQFVKQPSTWLNGECWDDEPDTGPGADDEEFVPSREYFFGNGK